MFEQLKSWLAVTGLATLTLGLLCALGLGIFLVIRVIYIGLSLVQMSFK